MDKKAILEILLDIEELIMRAETEAMLNDDGCLKGLSKAFDIVRNTFDDILKGV